MRPDNPFDCDTMFRDLHLTVIMENDGMNKEECIFNDNPGHGEHYIFDMGGHYEYRHYDGIELAVVATRETLEAVIEALPESVRGKARDELITSNPSNPTLP